MLDIISRLKNILKEDEVRTIVSVSGKYGRSELKAYDSGIAIVESALAIEPGSLVGIHERGRVDPIGFVVDVKVERLSRKLVLHASVAKGDIPDSFEMAEAEFLYSLRERMRILDRAEQIISRFRFVPTEKVKTESLEQPHLSLDEYELKAVEASLSLEDGEMLLVMGPPGTGKTQFIAEAARILAKKEKVFVTSQTHQAVDNMFERLPPSCSDYALRIGSHLKISDEARRFSPEHKYLENVPENTNDNDLAKEYVRRFEKIKLAQKDILTKNSFLVGATVTKSITDPLKEKQFDIVFIDEAHNLCFSSALLALDRTKKAVIVGDYWQLPPIYKSCNKLNDRVKFSTFNLFYDRMGKETQNLVWLQHHYRCNEKIIAFSSKYVYARPIRTIDKYRNQKLQLTSFAYSWLDPDKPIVFLDIESKEEINEKKSRFNIKEAHLVSWVSGRILEAGVKPKEVIVLTPFKAQVDKIREELKGLNNLMVKTVHRYVGGERDVVVFSVAATYPSSLGFIDKRMINVFVTRAKKKLIVIGSSQAIANSENSQLQNLYEYIQSEGLVLRL